MHRAFAAGVVAFGHVVATSAELPPGCTISGWAYASGFREAGTFSSTADCQSACAADANCTDFGYFPAPRECFLGRVASPLVKQNVSAEAGPKECSDETNACNIDAAPIGWPAETVEASMALWPGGFQPQVGQCYHPATCTAEPIVLQDVADGWPDYCQDLTDMTAMLGENETCEQSCLANVTCSAFQVGVNDTCWQGIGRDCSINPPWNTSFQPTAGKRYQRGSVRTLKELVGVQVMHLVSIFGVEQMAASDDAAQECFHICASILNCQYWQLSNTSGCWVEVEDEAQYPLVHGLNGLHEETDLAPTFTAGGYIQRFCPPEVVVDTATTTAAPEGIPAFAWILLAATILLCLGILAAVLYCLGCCTPKAKTRSKRGLKIAPKRSAQQPLVQQMQQNPSLFDQLDTNHDGVVTKDEFMRSMQVMGGAVAMQPVPTVAAPMPMYQMVPTDPAMAMVPQQQVAIPQHIAVPQQMAYQMQPMPVEGMAPVVYAASQGMPVPQPAPQFVPQPAAQTAPQPLFVQTPGYPPQQPMGPGM